MVTVSIKTTFSIALCLVVCCAHALALSPIASLDDTSDSHQIATYTEHGVLIPPAPLTDEEEERLLGAFSSLITIPNELIDDTDAIAIEYDDFVATKRPTATVVKSKAVLDEQGLSAIVTKCRNMYYTGGGRPEHDRLGYVRAASSLVWGFDQQQLAVIQDDVNFVGFVKWKDQADVRSDPKPTKPPKRKADAGVGGASTDDCLKYRKQSDEKSLTKLAECERKQQYKRGFRYSERPRADADNVQGDIEWQPGLTEGGVATPEFKHGHSVSPSNCTPFIQYLNQENSVVGSTGSICQAFCSALINEAPAITLILKSTNASDPADRHSTFPVDSLRFKDKKMSKRQLKLCQQITAVGKSSGKKAKKQPNVSDSCVELADLMSTDAETKFAPCPAHEASSSCESTSSSSKKDKKKKKHKHAETCAAPGDPAFHVPIKDDFHLEVDAVWSLALPHIDGRRQFGVETGNKQQKLDLESAVYLYDEDVMLAFGSGSTHQREKVVVVVGKTVLSTHAFYNHQGIVNAHGLYQKFRDTKEFSGSELNIEGATLLTQSEPRRIRFFQRGNGAPRGELLPISATCDVDLDDLLDYIREPNVAPVPELFNIVQFDLGTIGMQNIALGFTDATELPPNGRDDSPAVLYLAGAEDSPDTYNDGAVAGSVVGSVQCTYKGPWVDQCTSQYTKLKNPDGTLFAEKAEGLVLSHDDDGELSRNNAIIVLDPDNDRPARVCSVSLRGF